MHQTKWLSILMVMILGVAVTKVMAQEVPPLPVGEGSEFVAYRNDVIGVSLRKLPSQSQILEDRYLSDAFGITVVDPEGRMLLRVAWRYRDAAVQIEQRAKELAQSFPWLNLSPQPVRIGSYWGVMITNVPGIDPSTYTYLAAYGRLYEVVCPERGGEGCDVFLKSLSFAPVAYSPEGLGLLRANDVLHEEPPYLETPRPKGAEVDQSGSEVPQFDVVPMAAPGCADWPISKFIQTPWASTANGDSGWPQGWSRAGPSYYGEGLHQYCNRTNGLNDYHALDFRLKTWDIVYPPASGRVLYAGWAGGGWAGLGRVVIVDLGGGYWSMAAHLRSINVSVGQNVGISTVIGYAGGSGYNQDGYWSTHLHQGLYLNAYLNSTYGGIYGGQSVEPRNVRYFGNGGGSYASISKDQWLSW